jgi:hypothetical protein
MELIGKEKKLKPGESLKIEHAYKLINGKDELNKLIGASAPAGADNRAANPVLKTGVSYQKGIIGKGAFFEGKTRLAYKSKCIKAEEGTLEFWLKPEGSALKRLCALWGIGNNAPLRFGGSLNNGELSFMFTRKGEGGFYANLINKTSAIKAEWQQLAFVWKNNGPKKSIMQIYLNGKLLESRSNLTIGKNWSPPGQNLCIGFNSAAFKAEGFAGVFDEFRISSKAKTPNQILKAYERVKKGKELELQEDTLLLLHFENTVTGVGK